MTAREVSSERVSEERLQEIIAGCEGVTPGPWRPSTWGFQIVSDYPEAAWQSVVELRVKPQKYPERASSEEAASQEAIAYHLARLDPGTIRSIISELLSLRSSVKTEIRIKPLEWERVTESPVFHGDETKRFWKAANPSGGSSWVNVHTEDFEGEASWGGKKYPNSAAAMNAVEDHLRACILSAIEAPAAEGEQIDKTLLHGICDSLRAVIMEYEDMNMFPGSRAIMQGQLDALTSALKGDRP